MGEKIGAAQLLRFLIEHIDEFAADELALRLGVGDPGQWGGRIWGMARREPPSGTPKGRRVTSSISCAAWARNIAMRSGVSILSPAIVAHTYG